MPSTSPVDRISGPSTGSTSGNIENGIESEPIFKLHEGRPHILDAMKNKELHLIINTPSGKLSQYDDSYLRKGAIRHKIPYVTALSAALAAAKGIAARRERAPDVKSLQEYHRALKTV